MKNQEFQRLYWEADKAGVEAAVKAMPTPMVVSGGGKEYYVSEGACGFAWIKFAGNTPWGRWAKQNGIARSSYPKGLQIWVSEFGQSMDRKAAYAYAFAKVLQSAGIEAYAQSRMD